MNMVASRYLRPTPKQNRPGHKFKGHSEVKIYVARWLITRDTDFYEQSVETFVPLCYKRLGYGGKYVKKNWWDNNTNIYCFSYVYGTVHHLYS